MSQWGSRKARLVLAALQQICGKALKEGQCYAFIQLPILGGDYAIQNVAARDVAYQYAALGPIFEKLKDVPDGTRVSFEIKKP